MKKRVLALVLVCLLSLALLTACGGKKPSDEGNPADVQPVTPADTQPGGSEITIVTPEPAPGQTDPAAATPVPVVTPTPAATPVPTVPPTAAPTPTPANNLPIITKSPTDETVTEGGSAMFVARYENAIWAVWHFVSPDRQTDMTYEAAQSRWPYMEIVNGMYSTMTLRNIPLDLNGWTVYCRYTNNFGSTDTKSALITVKAAPTPAPTTAPTPAPTTAPTPAPEPTPVVNVWTDTTDLDTAIAGSGVSFTPPISEALPDLLTLKGYRYMSGIIQADYYDRNGQTVLTIRKSNTLSGSSLTGDYSSYSYSWDLTLKGLTVHCLGDGSTANNVTFGNGSNNYCILYNIGQEGYGLTADQINSLINSIQ